MQIRKICSSTISVTLQSSISSPNLLYLFFLVFPETKANEMIFTQEGKWGKVAYHVDCQSKSDLSWTENVVCVAYVPL